MRKLGFGIGVVALVAVIGGGGYYFLSAGANRSIKENLDQALQKLPPGWSAAYKSVDVGVATRDAIVKGVEIHGTGSTKLDATIDEIDISDPSLDIAQRWADAVANHAGLSPDQALPVADKITLKGVAVHMDNQDMHAGSTEIAKLRLYPWALLHDGVPSYGEIMARFQHPPAEPKPEDFLPALKFDAAMLLGVGEDNYAVSDLSGTAKVDSPDAQPVEGQYSIKKITASGVDRGKMATITGDGIAFKANTGDLALDHIEIDGLDAQAALNRVLTATALEPGLADGLALAKLEYDGLRVQAPQQAPVTLSAITVSDLAFARGMLASGRFSVTGVKVAKAQMIDEQAIDAFDKLGLDSATVSIGASYKWDPDKKTAVLKQAGLKIDELGSLTLTADLTGIDQSNALMTTAMLSHALLRYDDASLTGRALKLAATEQGADPAAVSQQMVAMVQLQTAMLGNSPAIKAAGAAVGSFLTDPHSLTIEFAPPQPMAVTALYGVKDLPPPKVFDVLGIKVTANQAAVPQ